MSPFNDNDELPLSEADLRMYEYFRITRSLLRDAGVRRVTDGEARGKYGIWWRDLSVDLSGVLYPYYHQITHEHVTCRLRLDNPITDNEGKVHKYLAPPHHKARSHLYSLTNADPWLKDTTVPIVFVESEKSVLACTAAAERAKRSLLFIGLGGCMGWWGRIGRRLRPDGNTEDEHGPLPDFGYFDFTERTTTILFDSNSAINGNVRHARRRLAVFLTQSGAVVKIAELGDLIKPSASNSKETAE
jgi:hypothetical protein